ncbi:related to Polyamine oxidase FMS1 [Saccharomycodes ludwigii]|uniref:Related to Polyamine oxidase FMS1 n=1 Tax=Saccharomycodes ludwigii TaxID=36035 RepID=A0A376B0Y3_9ASCO|nr:hypothetical protein SCDLUD_004183 [Saccharomycodes ludwigii]KAH3899883.1 hypothetical protein SCDLUD_004183 [Saccharomycodes ludwigii]SSD58346.1 related to Polyamine oxidase FMS1 [Saccharomycodes ludwigii]
MTDSTIETKIVIIGCGIAGLKAAQELYQQKFCQDVVETAPQVLILEARDRIGGRLYTVDGLNDRYDIGAAWHHDILRNPLFQEEHELKKKNLTASKYIFDDDYGIIFDEMGTKLNHDKDLKLEVVQNELEKFVELEYFSELEYPNTSYFKMVQKYLFRYKDFLTDAQIKYLNGSARCIELWHGTNWKKLSGKYAQMDHQGRNAMCLFYKDVVDRMATEFPLDWIKLHSQVCQIKALKDKQERISNRNRNLEILTKDTKNGKITKVLCDYVIVTIPQSVLEQSLYDVPAPGRIEFIPKLNQDIYDSFQNIHYGALGKIIFEFDSAWESKHTRFYYTGAINNNIIDAVRNGQAFNGEYLNKIDSLTTPTYNNTITEQLDPQNYPLLFVNYMGITGKPSLVMLMQDPLTSYIEKLNAQDEKATICNIFKPILLNLFKHLGYAHANNHNGSIYSEILPGLKNIIVSNWTIDPYSLGSFTACYPDDDPIELSLSLERGQSMRIRFAGEHTIMDGAGCVYGAFESGKREAQYILNNYF